MSQHISVDRLTCAPWAGGPGFEAPRLSEQPSWMKSALNVFRIILLDQRGTGLSTPITQLSLARQGSPAEQAQYLRHFRCALC